MLSNIISKNNMVKCALIVGLFVICNSCYQDEKLNVPVKDTNVDLSSPLDRYIEDNFTKKYGMAIRYRFVDRYVDPNERVTPPRLDVVRPMLDFIQKFWIDPYLEVANGEEFFKNHVPAEIVLLGGFIFNEDGTVTLGTADAGAQITFTNVNSIDPDDLDWRALQLQTVYHEFAHTVHQRYKLPTAFETISPNGYSSAGSWFNVPEEEALQRGFVSPYATSSPNEDFAETVAFYLFDTNFLTDVLTDETNCDTPECAGRNEGRERIRQKLNAISSHYEKVTGVNLQDLREAIQSKL
ncbi:putative zinc-binding metallopeptidase [Fulvivirgaceae bacterium BMA10]|uniref:Zinc-binding metallopeptidase n=1 Tax=Splendidivirga corallicola TaxID=3051826 RepID=A0ABT8KNT7_9BACT|nr:putative zinc-binding metallopeptidase [Fulvivirgaceae bacterium BMA10]